MDHETLSSTTAFTMDLFGSHWGFYQLQSRDESTKQTNSSGSTDDLVEEYLQYRIGDALWVYVSPLLLFIGTVGNVLSVLVLLRRSLRRSTTMFYLACLSVGDLFTLYTGLLRYWVRAAFHTDVRTWSDLGCKIHVFLVYVSLDFTVWVLVSVTVDRCLSVTLPFKSRRICTLRRSKVVVVVILCVLALKNVHFLWNLELSGLGESRECDGRSENARHFYRFVWPWIDFSTFCLIPFSIMILCNIKIIYEMVLSRRKLKTHSGFHGSVPLAPVPERVVRFEKAAPGQSDPALLSIDSSKSNDKTLSTLQTNGSTQAHDTTRNHDTRLNHSASRQISNCGVSEERTVELNDNGPVNNNNNNTAVTTVLPQKRYPSRTLSTLTAMLLTVNCVFLVTTTPIQVFLIGEHYWFPDTTQRSKVASHNFYWALVNMLQYTNNCVHFFLYCLTGPRFRQELKCMFRKNHRVSTVGDFVSGTLQ